MKFLNNKYPVKMKAVLVCIFVSLSLLVSCKRSNQKDKTEKFNIKVEFQKTSDTTMNVRYINLTKEKIVFFTPSLNISYKRDNYKQEYAEDREDKLFNITSYQRKIISSMLDSLHNSYHINKDSSIYNMLLSDSFIFLEPNMTREIIYKVSPLAFSEKGVKVKISDPAHNIFIFDYSKGDIIIKTDAKNIGKYKFVYGPFYQDTLRISN